MNLDGDCDEMNCVWGALCGGYT
jgi:hypothetical protein